MRGHSSLLSNLWCTASKPEAPRIYTEHLSMNPANMHSFEAHIGSKEHPFAFPSPLNLPSPSHLPAIPTQPKFAISEEIREAAVILWYNYRYR